MKVRWMLLLAVFLPIMSCTREGIEVITYDRIYRVSGIFLSGGCIKPTCIYEDEANTNSKLFYESLDTSLFFKKKHTSKVEYDEISAIDWRIENIIVEALDDYDQTHLAGACLNDVLMIRYEYKTNKVFCGLSDLHYGSLMLTDYYPYAKDFSMLYLVPFDESQTLDGKRIRLTITDSFGNSFVTQSAGVL